MKPRFKYFVMPVPAYAGINSSGCPNVTPAKAGGQRVYPRWIPAFAGMALLHEQLYAQEIRDVKPPVNQPFELVKPDANPLWIILAVVVVVALSVYAYWRIKNRQKKNVETLIRPQRLPWEIAYEELERLKREDLLTRGRVKDYYVRLSDIVRHYLEGRFNLRAPEMTTEEFLHSLKYSTDLGNLPKDALKNFLNACDMVKFAKHDPDLREAEQSFQFAQKLVDETKVVEVSAKT